MKARKVRIIGAFLVMLLLAGSWLPGFARVKTLRGHSDGISSLAFAPDGRTLASGGYDGTARLWNMKTRQCLFIFNHSGTVKCVAFSPDGRTLAVATNADEKIVPGGLETNSKNGSQATLWDVNSRKIKGSMAHQTLAVQSLAFAPDGKTLATGSYDETVKLWDLETGKIRRSHDGYYSLGCVRFSPDGRLLAATGGHQVRLWNAATGAHVATLERHSEMLSLAFTPDSSTLASASRDGTVKLWDVAKGTLQKTLRCPQQWATDVAFSPDGKILAVGSSELPIELPRFMQADGRAQLWLLSTGKAFVTFKGHSCGIERVAFTPDGKTLVTGGFDGVIKLWDVPAGKR